MNKKLTLCAVVLSASVSSCMPFRTNLSITPPSLSVTEKKLMDEYVVCDPDLAFTYNILNLFNTDIGDVSFYREKEKKTYGIKLELELDDFVAAIFKGIALKFKLESFVNSYDVNEQEVDEVGKYLISSFDKNNQLNVHLRYKDGASYGAMLFYETDDSSNEKIILRVPLSPKLSLAAIHAIASDDEFLDEEKYTIFFGSEYRAYQKEEKIIIEKK